MLKPGYLDPTYVISMAGDAKPVPLARSGGWIILRQIPGSGLKDAMAPHPFLVCRDWRGLKDDIAGLDRSLVSLVAVTDPLADVKESELRETFNHLVRPYKEHFIMDLSRPLVRSSFRTISAGPAGLSGMSRSSIAKILWARWKNGSIFIVI